MIYYDKDTGEQYKIVEHYPSVNWVKFENEKGEQIEMAWAEFLAKVTISKE